MKLRYGLTIDGFDGPSQAQDSAASHHSPGLSDELGDRLLIYDKSSAPTLELLRFRRTLTAMPGFEVALRRRVERLSHVHHPSLVAVHGVEYVGGGHGLVLVSNHTSGKRMSDVLRVGRDPAFATALIRQLMPPLTMLHDHGDGVGHGALTASRIVVTPEGGLVIVEHLVGSALERLQMTASRFESELGIALPPGNPSARPRLDDRTDCYQLAVIALSLLIGRRLNAAEASVDVGEVLEDALPEDHALAATRGLRLWLEHALQLNGKSFDSSKSAEEAISELSQDDDEETAQRWKELLSFRLVERAEIPSMPTAPASSSTDAMWVVSTQSPLRREREFAEPAGDLIRNVPDEQQSEALALVEADLPVTQTISVDAPARITDQDTWPGLAKTSSHKKWWALVATLALCAVAEGVVIAGLLTGRWFTPTLAEVKFETQDPGAAVTVNGQPAGVTPLQLKIGPEMHSISIASRAGQSGPDQAVGITGDTTSALPTVKSKSESPVRSSPPVPAAPPPQRVGGIRFSSPIALEVFEGDKRLGSTAGIVSAPAGRHEVELVNSALGFRTRQVIEVKGGQVIPVTISPPNGSVNINAVPWAEVLINGKSVGETPIGNLSLPLGEHEIVFRHPQLGEQRRTATVRLDGVTRVSVNLQR
jgi:PEGA domain